MDLLVIAFVFAIGITVGYMIFYFRYEQREVVDEMRNRLESNAHDIQIMKTDLIEYTEQNKILKEKANDLLVKNDDLSKIVADMSRYYQYLRQAHEKAKDLSDFLKIFDTDTDHKSRHAPYISKGVKTTESHTDYLYSASASVDNTIESKTSIDSSSLHQTKKVF